MNRTLPQQSLCASRAGTRAKRPIQAAPQARGRLLIVVGADPCHADLILMAARRRLAANASDLYFPHRVSTRRRTPIPGDVAVNQRVFATMEAEGSFLFTWRDEFGRHGFGTELRSRLQAGHTVVVGLPPSAEAEARAAWPDVRVINLTGHTAPMRTPLTAAACMARLMRPIAPVRALARRLPRSDAAVNCDDLAGAVGKLSGILAAYATPATARA